MPGTTRETHVQEDARLEMALDRCLVEGDADTRLSARRTRRKTFGVSLAIELLMLGLLVAAPLLTSGAKLQLHQILPPQLTFFGAWREHSPARHVAPATAARKPEFPNPFPPPTAIGVTVRPEPNEERGDIPIPEMPDGYVPGTVRVIASGGTPAPAELPQIAQPAQQTKRPVKLSEGVLAAQIISRVEPRCPTLAIQTKTEGEVRLRAIISRDGRITSLDVISGHPFLVRAALDAVRQWRYRPTLLNGEPVEVETSITVIFRLHE